MTTTEPAARPTRPAAAADRRPVRHGALRRHRRPVAQEGHAGDLRPRQPRPAAARLQPGRLRPPRLGRPGLRADRARLGEGSTPAPSSARRSGSSSPRASGSSRATSTTTTPSTSCGAPSRSSTRSAAPAATTRSTWRSRRASSATSSGSSRSTGSPTPARRLLAPGRRREAVRPRPRSRPASSTTSLGEVFPPDSIFRIDHYLGKETVQNILAMRFANEMFEPIWNANYVDHVQITMAEDVGIGGRAGYYDGIGAARDVIQNHLLQLMALVAMEEPTSFDADEPAASRSRRCSPASRCPRRLDLTTARGQYAAGWAGRREGRRLPRGGGHRARPRRPRRSPRSRCNVDNRRWAGVPFYLRTGKRLGRRVTEVAVVFKRAPHLPFTRVRDRGAHPERPGDPGPARRGHHAAVRLQGARHRDGDPRRQHGLRLRRLVHRVVARRPTSG